MGLLCTAPSFCNGVPKNRGPLEAALKGWLPKGKAELTAKTEGGKRLALLAWLCPTTTHIVVAIADTPDQARGILLKAVGNHSSYPRSLSLCLA